MPSFTDAGLYCFQSPCFDAIFPHHMFLYEVICQNEADLIAARNELCDGTPSDETKKLMKSLQGPLPQDLQSKAIYIFGTNFDVNFHNCEQLSKLVGAMKIYNANDRGPVKYLQTCNAPRILGIKLNAKVIIICNLPNGLVNGLSATVTDYSDTKITICVDEDPHLHHNLTGRIFELERFNFCIRDENNKVAANREQFPLKLGYAMTVDKAQGRTLDAVVVDCYNFWRCGQLGVVVGRSQNKASLQIQNFNNFASTLQHPQVVKNFYQKPGKPLKTCKLCCKNKVNIPAVHVLPTLFAPPQIQNMDTNMHNENDDTEIELSFPYNIEEFITGELFEPGTPIQEQRNQLLISASKTKEFQQFLGHCYHYLDGLVRRYCIKPKKNKM